MKPIAIGMLVFLGASNALAGWVSGGGELMQDAGNPWFIQNTKVVKACIQVDSEHFHRPADALSLQQVVEAAVNYWNKEFAGTTQKSGDIENHPEVGLNKFEFSECTADTDIRFQFGILSAEQKQRFKEMGHDPRKFVSMAVRAEYDRVNLKGKGFIYIAADSGPLRPLDDTFADQPWALGEGGLLTKVVAHELGHVYGVPHTTDGGRADIGSHQLMAAGYPEAITKKFGDFYNQKNLIPRFFTSEDISGGGQCPPVPFFWSQNLLRFLGAPKNTTCLMGVKKNSKIDLTYTINPDSRERIPLGTVQLLPSTINQPVEYLMRFWLPREQTVIKLPPGGSEISTLPIGRSRNILQHHGIYRDVKGTVTRHVIVTTLPDNRVLMGGILDSGEMIVVPPLHSPASQQ